MSGKDIFQYVLGIVVVMAFVALLYFLFTKEIPWVNMNLLSLIIGALIGSFTTVVQYFFGSSKGSAEKSEILRKDKDDGK